MTTTDNTLASSISRRLETLEYEGQDARSIIIERPYLTNIDDLWQAIVDPKRLQRWFLPVSGELHEGGRYQLDGNAGGLITVCDAPKRLQLTWEMNGGISWVHLTLCATSENETLLTLEHISHEDAEFLEFWKQYGPGAVGVGWDIGFMSLADYIAAGDDYTALDEEAWIASDEGKEFTTTASTAWVAAAIEFGTDKSAAELAGKRTSAFYTGTEFKEES